MSLIIYLIYYFYSDFLKAPLAVRNSWAQNVLTARQNQLVLLCCTYNKNKSWYFSTLKSSFIRTVTLAGLNMVYTEFILHISTFFWIFYLEWSQEEFFVNLRKDILFRVSKSYLQSFLIHVHKRSFHKKNRFFTNKIEDDNEKNTWSLLRDCLSKNWFGGLWSWQRLTASVRVEIYAHCKHAALPVNEIRRIRFF